jgi:hypothetical protein
MIDNPASDIYNAKGENRGISMQSKFVVWEVPSHGIGGYVAE